MKDANFEKDLKNRLADHHSPMDFEMEWAALDARREKKRKRPIAWIWWGTGILLLGIVSWFIFVPSNLQKEQHKDEIAIMPTSKKAIPKTKNATLIDKTSEVIPTLQEIEMAGPSVSKDVLPAAQKNTSNGSTPSFSSSNYSAILNKKILAPNPVGNKTYQNQTPSNQSLLKGEDSISSFSKCALLPLRQAALVFPKETHDLELETFQKTVLPPPSTPSKWTIGLFAGYGKTFRNLSAESGDLHSLIARRNDAETPLDQWHTAIQMRRSIGQNWFVDLGLGFSQATDRFETVFVSNTMELRDNQLISITHRNDGSIDEAYGPALVDVMTTTSAQYYQYHRKASLLLLGGRRFSLNRHFGTAISAGLDYGLWTRQKGKVFSDATLNNYADLADGDYRKTGLINALFNIEIYYRIHPSLEFSLGLNGQRYLNNAFRKAAGVAEQRQVVGLQFGLRKPLGL